MAINYSFVVFAVALLAGCASAQGVCPASACPVGTQEILPANYSAANAQFQIDLAHYGFDLQAIALLLQAVDLIYVQPSGLICGGPKELVRLANYMDLLAPIAPIVRAQLPEYAQASRVSNCYALYDVCTSSSTCRSYVSSFGPSCKRTLDAQGFGYMVNTYNCYYGQATLDCISRCYLYTAASGAYTTCASVNQNYFVNQCGCNGDCLKHCPYSNRVACSD